MATALRDRVFISYSHKDKKPWLEKLETMLAPLVRQGRLSVWADTAIAPGDKWRREIEEGLARARVAVLLVSPDFLASRFIAEHELPPLLEAAEREGVKILPVLFKECLWRETEIAQYQFAFLTDTPLAELRGAKRDRALTRVAEAISAAAESPVSPPSGHASSGPPSKVFQVPHERNPFFTGREHVLDEVAARLQGRGLVAFSALGGMGKTQCAYSARN
jgi:TIR domain-containing protein